MPYEVRPKQHLLELSEADLYRELLDLQQKFNATAAQTSSAMREDLVSVYEIKDIIEDPAWKRKLNKELEKYEILQHSRRFCANASGMPAWNQTQRFIAPLKLN
jgi:heme oxygenase